MFKEIRQIEHIWLNGTTTKPPTPELPLCYRAFTATTLYWLVDVIGTLACYHI